MQTLNALYMLYAMKFSETGCVNRVARCAVRKDKTHKMLQQENVQKWFQ